MNAKLPPIDVGYDVFLADGADAFGAVREVMPQGRPTLVVNVQGGGDFPVPLEAIVKVASQRVVLRWDLLEESLRRAIRHTLDEEDFPPNGEPEVELIPASEDSDDDDPRVFYEGPAVSSPLDELPGRDVGSRYGAPTTISPLKKR